MKARLFVHDRFRVCGVDGSLSTGLDSSLDGVLHVLDGAISARMYLASPLSSRFSIISLVLPFHAFDGKLLNATELSFFQRHKCVL